MGCRRRTGCRVRPEHHEFSRPPRQRARHQLTVGCAWWEAPLPARTWWHPCECRCGEMPYPGCHTRDRSPGMLMEVLVQDRRSTQKGPLMCGPFLELPGIEPVSGCWSLSRTGAELQNDICDSPELTSV